MLFAILHQWVAQTLKILIMQEILQNDNQKVLWHRVIRVQILNRYRFHFLWKTLTLTRMLIDK